MVLAVSKSAETISGDDESRDLRNARYFGLHILSVFYVYTTKMDKGAARSRKRTQPSSNSETSAPKNTASNSSTIREPISTSTSQSGPSRPSRPASVHKSRSIREPQSRDPALYRAKAVRSAAALVYSEDAFPLPPPKDILKGVRRIDLAGSGVKDIDWLKDCGEVTWLNLAGCEGLSGWEGIGHLEKLSGESNHFKPWILGANL